MKRDTVVWVDLSDAHPPEMGKVRPAVIVSGDVHNATLDTVVVVPTSSLAPEILPLTGAGRHLCWQGKFRRGDRPAPSEQTPPARNAGLGRHRATRLTRCEPADLFGVARPHAKQAARALADLLPRHTPVLFTPCPPRPQSGPRKSFAAARRRKHLRTASKQSRVIHSPGWSTCLVRSPWPATRAGPAKSSVPASSPIIILDAG